MRKLINRIPFNTIRFKLIAGLLIIIIPLILLLWYDNFYAIDVIHNQVSESNKNLMSLYMSQVDKSLDNTDGYLNRIAALDTDFHIMEYTNEKYRYDLAEYNLSRRLSEDILLNKSIDSVFIYANEKRNLIMVNNDGSTYDERQTIKEYITKIVTDNPYYGSSYLKSWYVEKIGKKYYVFRILKTEEGYIGAWVSAKRLLVPLNLIDLGDNGASFLVSGNGEIMISSNDVYDKYIDLNRDLSKYYKTGEKNQFLVVGEKSSKGNFSLIALVPDEKILEKLPSLQKIIAIIAGCAVFLPILYLLLLRKIILTPINRIIKTMKKIQKGDLEVRIPTNENLEEFKIVNETFNNMMTEIHDLKINVYEEKLNKQKAELQHLQLQVQPHFFLNSLNIIYSLAQTQNYKLIQEMTLSLVQYFRYMFRSNLSFVTLKEELQHVRNYMRIQELRFPNSLYCEINADEAVMNCEIPPLIIQSFAENTVKYAVTMDELINLWIDVEQYSNENSKYLKISIRDTGKGFAEEILKDLQQGNRIVDENGEHIGAWNVRKRLNLLYSGHGEISFSNGTGPIGAVVEILLPLEIKTSWEEK
jgi:two-component system sensor histidine kinase YesM